MCILACVCVYLPCMHVCVLLLKHIRWGALKHMSGCGRYGMCIDQRTALLCWLSASTFMCFPEGELLSLNLLGKCLYLLSHLGGSVVWSSLWSGGGGHTHKHARMHAHVHTPHVWGCSQGPKEELHDHELLDMSARNGTWVLCKSSRHSYWLSHNLPSPIILYFCSKSCLVYHVTPRALPGCSFAALSFLSPFLSLRPLTTWHRSIPV